MTFCVNSLPKGADSTLEPMMAVSGSIRLKSVKCQGEEDLCSRWETTDCSTVVKYLYRTTSDSTILIRTVIRTASSFSAVEQEPRILLTLM
jgi:hypothetical protein